MSSFDSPDRSPALWNPSAAAGWSLVFTPAFGAYLHARNAAVLGRVEEAKANRIWFQVSLGYQVFVCASIFIPSIPEPVFRGAVVGLLLGWYVSVGRKQVVYVKGTYSADYHRRSWTKPLVIACSALILFLIVGWGLLLLQE